MSLKYVHWLFNLHIQTVRSDHPSIHAHPTPFIFSQCCEKSANNIYVQIVKFIEANEYCLLNILRVVRQDGSCSFYGGLSHWK